MTSPDVQGYIDLSLYDATPGVLVDRALLAATTRLPEWQPREGNTELVLMEALAVEVSELIYSLNRVPSAVLDGALDLYGVERSLGTKPTATVTFTLTAPTGYQVPAGTTVRLELGGEEEPLDFTTDAAVVVPTGATSVTAAVTATRATDVANGRPAGTALSMVTPIPYVDSVALATAVTGGTDPEDDVAYRERGAQRLARLVSTLVLPEHFTADALETVGVFRARTLDNFDAATSNEQQTVTITGGPTGGTFTLTFGGQTTAAIAYNATAAAVVAALEALSNVGAANVTATGGPLPGTAVVVTFTGRLGSQNVALMTATSALTGGTSPAVTVTETRAGGFGARAGYVSVAVLGSNGARLSAAAKADIQSRLDSRAQANLAVQVIDPGINTVDVTATVRARVGYTAADVTANVTAALDAFLSPDTWPWSAIVRRNDLIALIENAEGVDYLLTGHPTVPAGDVTLTGAAPLAGLGAVALTVQV
jgi:uncharacterized phage protein gp47/JayE